MDLDRTLSQRVNRRTVLGRVAMMGATLALAACASGDDDPNELGAATDSADEEEVEEGSPDDQGDEEHEDPGVESGGDDDEGGQTSAESDQNIVADAEDEVEQSDEGSGQSVDADAEAEVIVDDVIDFTLGPEGRWDGPFGSVTMRLHRGWIDGEDVTFIRTDASDQDFATREGLVYVPLMANALEEPGSHADLYLFDVGHEGQRPVLSTSPADGENFSPAFRIHNVMIVGKTSIPITSEQQILDAAERGVVEIDTTDVIVNYPVITWPGGKIPVDEEKVEALGGGQLIEDPDIEGGRVTLKLHQCYPDSRYIITDTSALPMAPMMGAGEAGASQLLIDVDAVAPITIFLNGLEGTGAMGFQPGIFNTSAGDPAWSPFWEHFAAEWVNEGDAIPVTSQRQLDELVDAGDLILYGGVPDTDPDTFVVNCSVPIVAPVTWEPPG